MAFKVAGVTSPAKVAGVTAPAKVGGVTAPAGGGSVTLRGSYSAYADNVGSVAVQQNDLIVVFFSCISGDVDVTPTDGFNTYSKAASKVQAAGGVFGTGVRGAIWYAKADANRTLTVTCPASLTDPGISVHVYYGQNLTTPLDGTPVTYADAAEGTSHVTGNITVTGGSGILFCGWGQEDAGMSHSNLSGWTVQTEQTTHIHATADKAYASNGDYSGSITSSGSEAYIGVLVAFKAAT